MPVDFSLTDEQLEIRALARDFARREIRPVAAEYDAREEMPWPVLAKAARVGLLSYGLPEEYGGGGVADGMVGITNFLVTEELAWGCAAIATEIGSSSYAAGPIRRFRQRGAKAALPTALLRPRGGEARCPLPDRAAGGLRHRSDHHHRAA
ncbi:MAG TPA: acyl-CoA dehydrogenase family protein [Solirubrobacterales bacterium]